MIDLIPFAQAQIAAVTQMHGTDITLRWREQADPEIDRTTGAELGAAPPVEKSEVLRGMVHFIAPILSESKRFAEIASGDAMLDLPPETVLEGRRELVFEFDGKTWAAKKISDVLRDYWDVIAGGQRLYRTVLVGLR
jgi:hypothetical protein